MPQTQHLLTITLAGPQQPGLTRAIVSEVAERGCNILDCRVAPIGNQYFAALMVDGNWSSLGRLETALPGIAEQLGLGHSCNRSEHRTDNVDMRPYAVEIIAPQTPGLLKELLDYFHAQGIEVVEVVAQNYDAMHTGAPLANLQLVVHVPMAVHPPTLRESFMDLCDDLHADGLLDPIKV